MEQVYAKSTAFLADIGKIQVIAHTKVRFLSFGEDFDNVTLELGIRDFTKLDG
jgi:hypothetical protein